MKSLYNLSLVLLLAGIFNFTACKEDEEEPLVDTTQNELVDITSQTQFDDAVKDGVSLIFYHAVWCKLCAEQRPAVEGVSTNAKFAAVFFGEVEYEEHKDLVKSRKIDGFPTVVVYKDNLEVKRFNGKGHSQQSLEDALTAALN